ncbi:MAG: hypothetical protein FJW39_24590 [Acidobacteria bacterium]|nr:hypothetical protein [Acidobacteriota bacterium]
MVLHRYLLSTLLAFVVHAQPYPNPYRMVDGWARLPEGRKMGAVGGVTIDPDQKHVWAIMRCDAGPERFGNECLDSGLDPVLKFDMTGKVVRSFGGGMFIWPHGIHADRQGNIWVTDAVSSQRTPKGVRGHQVVKFSAEGKVLMRLGTPGVAGSGADHLNAPSDVTTLPNGEILVADGHNPDGNNRVARFSADGKFINSWGGTGHAPGEFRSLHAIALDSRGRVFIADRGNNRIQIFDAAGKHLATWTQFGKPSGIFFDANDRIYVADSESDEVENPGWEVGIRIGSARSGWVDTFVRFPWADPRLTRGFGAEFVAVDRDGNLYAGEPFLRVLRKYERIR